MTQLQAANTTTPLVSSIVNGDRTFKWDDLRSCYRSNDGRVLNPTSPQVREAISTAELRYAELLIEAALDDEATLAHLPQPSAISCGPLTGSFGTAEREAVAGVLTSLARSNGDWRPVSLTRLVNAALSSDPHKLRWRDREDVLIAAMHLANSDAIVIWSERVHFTEQFVRRLHARCPA